MTNKNQECCLKFSPEQWNEKVFTLFLIPLNFGSVITRMMAKVDKAGAKTPDNLCLSDHTSNFDREVKKLLKESEKK